MQFSATTGAPYPISLPSRKRTRSKREAREVREAYVARKVIITTRISAPIDVALAPKATVKGERVAKYANSKDLRLPVVEEKIRSTVMPREDKLTRDIRLKESGW